MIKVRILTGVTAATAATVLLPTTVGCNADVTDDTGTGDSAITGAVAGSGELILSGYSLYYRSTSGGDEFVRVGEKMKVGIRLEDVIQHVAWSDPALETALRADPSKLAAELKVRYTRKDGSTSDEAPLPITWGPGSGGAVAGTSPEFAISKEVKGLAIEIVAQYDDKGTPRRVDILESNGIRRDFVVFGAFVPNKLALFDTDGATPRTRIVEGGRLVAGAEVLLSYTDWRLDTFVDKGSLDLVYGQQQNFSRFGPSIVDALGSLEYVVTAAVSMDGGKTYTSVSLDRAATPDVLSRADGWRYAFQRGVGIPSGASEIKVAFHIEAYLQVPDYRASEIKNPRYSPGQRILLRDVWDNNGRANHSLPVKNP